MMVDESGKNWFADGEAYERYIGRWSRPTGAMFLDWLAQPADLRWVDVGCGTGALSEAVLERSAPSSVVGIEPSEDFLGMARERIREARVTLLHGDAQDLPLADAEADVVVSGLVLNFVPDPERALG